MISSSKSAHSFIDSQFLSSNILLAGRMKQLTYYGMDLTEWIMARISSENNGVGCLY
jgi:hypothetical protein